MADNRPYRDPIIKLLIDKFEEQGPKDLRGRYWYGDPVIVAQNQKVLPACFISPPPLDETLTDTINADRSEKTYRITVAIERKAQWQQGGDRYVGEQMKVAEYLIGMDEAGAHRTDSIMAVLRNNRVLSGPNKIYVDLARPTRARIEPNLGGRGTGMFTYDGTLEVVITKREPRVVA